MNNNKYNVSKNVGSFASNQAARYKIARLYMAFSTIASYTYPFDFKRH